jgi:spore maturation protein CgeB
MSKTILIVTSSHWDGALMASYQRAFVALGFRVVTFDLEAERRGAFSDRLGFARGVFARLLPYLWFPSIDAKANRVLAMKAVEVAPDVLVVSCNEAVRPATLAYLRTALPGTKLVTIFPDTLFNMRESLVQSLPLYDVFATHTHAGVDVLRKMGCPEPFYLPLAADPELHRPQELSPADVTRFGCDVTYVGNWRVEHERLFEGLRDFDLAIWGPDQWRRAAPTSFAHARWRGQALQNGLEYAKAHCAAKIGLNPIDPLNYPGHNMRCFELPACNVFSLVSRTPEVIELFTEGKTVVTFEGRDELADKVRYYLAHPDERQRIAAAAHEHVVRGGHTYLDRARSLLGRLGFSC